jgi:hypothetical protein
MVHEREGDKVVVWDERKSLTEWTTKTVSVNDLEEVQK